MIYQQCATYQSQPIELSNYVVCTDNSFVFNLIRIDLTFEIIFRAVREMYLKTNLILLDKYTNNRENFELSIINAENKVLYSYMGIIDSFVEIMYLYIPRVYTNTLFQQITFL